MKGFNVKLVVKILSISLLVEGFFLLLSAMVSFLYKESDFLIFLFSGILTLFVGLFGLFFTYQAKSKIENREAFFTISFFWILFSLFGLLPFVFGSTHLSFTDGFFETISGLTTTACSVLLDVENVSHGLLFWRSIIQWIGGMCVILLSLAILPLLGIVGGVRSLSFDASSSTFSSNKLHPRIIETIKWLSIVYLLLTIIQTLLLFFGGVDFFDALCHSFSTISTGGFSTKQANIAYFNSSYVEYVFIFFMLIAGSNFTLLFFLRKGKFAKFFKNEEFRMYLYMLFFFSLFVFVGLCLTSSCYSIEKSIRTSLFHVISTLTTSGFHTVNYMSWHPLLWTVVVSLMIFGSSVGSASGGIKVIRISLVFKNAYNEFKRFIHPNALLPIRFNNTPVSLNLANNIFIFILSYFFFIIFGVLVLSAAGSSFSDSIILVIGVLGNVGCNVQHFSNIETLSSFPIFLKWFLSFLMLIGRLELFVFLVLFSRSFWQK